MRSEWTIAVLWIAFLLRLGFYSCALPLWEGYDEWAHFAVIRAMARGEALPRRDAPLPRDVEESLRIVPVPWELRNLPPPALPEDAYWQLPPTARAARMAALRQMPHAWQQQSGSGPLRAYEALQPPLYYWLMTPLLFLAGGAPLAFQVLLLRWTSILIASFTLPFAYLAAREAFRDARLAVGCAAVLAVMPEFAFDVARTGNDCLAVTLFTAITWLALRVTRAAKGTAYALGIVLGCGLLTKAYFLTAVPALAIILVPLGRGALARGLLPAVPIAGWWYLRNLFTTGTFSGLSESVMLRGESPLAMLGRIPHVPWGTAVDSILLSHLWFGGWSSLTVRSWMYHLFYALILAAAAGCCFRLRSSGLLRPLLLYAFFWLGQLYNVLLIFASKGVPTSMGWYLYAVVAAEVILCVAGLGALLPKSQNAWPSFAGVFLFAALDLYTVHAVAIPYYTGMIAHRANGSLAAVHGRDLAAVGFYGAFRRLSDWSGLPLAGLLVFWALYLGATITVLAFAWRAATSAHKT